MKRIGKLIAGLTLVVLPLFLGSMPVWKEVGGALVGMPTLLTGPSKYLGTTASDGTGGVLLGPFTAGQSAIWFRTIPSAATTTNYSIGSFDSGNTLMFHTFLGGFLWRQGDPSDHTIASMDTNGALTVGSALNSQLVIAGNATNPTISVTSGSAAATLDISGKGTGGVSIGSGGSIKTTVKCTSAVTDPGTITANTTAVSLFTTNSGGSTCTPASTVLGPCMVDTAGQNWAANGVTVSCFGLPGTPDQWGVVWACNNGASNCTSLGGLSYTAYFLNPGS